MSIKLSDLNPATLASMGLDPASGKSKYNVSRKDARTCDGILFASKREMNHYRALKQQVAAGIVSYFLRQIPLHLEGGVKYVVDFQVFKPIHCGGKPAYDVEYHDAKGCRTDVYTIKRKQVAARYGITIREV